MAAPPQPQVPPQPQTQAPPQLMGQVGASGQQAAAGVPPLAGGPAPSGMQVAAQAQDFDPVQRFRLLLPQLKESLQARGTPGPMGRSGWGFFLNPQPQRLPPSSVCNLMKVAAQNFVQNTSIDSGQKISDVPVQRVDKSLEEFYALCDQLELCLRLAYECLSQSFDSAKHSPTLVPTATKPDAVQAESLPYTQYLSMIKSQISCAKDIHNALLECSNKITGKVPSQGTL